MAGLDDHRRKFNETQVHSGEESFAKWNKEPGYAAAYAALEAGFADPEEGLRQGLEDIAEGRTRPAREVFEEFRAKHRIPR